MSVEHTKAKPFKNTALWLLIVVALLAALVANYAFPAISWPVRLISWVVLVGVAFALALLTDQGKRFWSFSKLARNELRKVVWPTRAETTQSTVFVGVMVVVLALLLWGIDAFWLWLVTLITA